MIEGDHHGVVVGYVYIIEKHGFEDRGPVYKIGITPRCPREKLDEYGEGYNEILFSDVRGGNDIVEVGTGIINYFKKEFVQEKVKGGGNYFRGNVVRMKLIANTLIYHYSILTECGTCFGNGKFYGAGDDDDIICMRCNGDGKPSAADTYEYISSLVI